MSAFLEAAKLYDGTDLQQIMVFCARYGFVHSDDDCFVCAYRTHHSLIETKSKQFIETESKELDKPDTWYVYIASGSLKKAIKMAEPMEYVAYRRFDNKFRLIKMERFYGR